MFSEQPGPSALQAELVHALSFSEGTVPLDPTGAPTRAAVVAVWNGEQGLVVVILRQVDPPSVRRFQFDEKIMSVAALDRALEQANTFVESFGFRMDDAEFRDLEESRRSPRLKEWNALRKVRKKSAGKPATGASGTGADTAEPSPSAGPAAAAAHPDANWDASRSVLGRLALVRRGHKTALARILGHF
jgi:hypothetical protein